MATYAFQKSQDGALASSTIKGGFDSRAEAHYFALAYFEGRKITIVCAEPDDVEDGFDFAVSRNGALEIYAINKVA